jgi:hypothetical protein
LSGQEEKAKSDPAERLLDACSITDLNALAERCKKIRHDHHQPTTRWAAPCLHAALHLAVVSRQWPAAHARAALLSIAADPTTRSPMRLAEAGPWWDQPTGAQAIGAAGNSEELARLDKLLDDTDGLRHVLQAQARQQLSDEGTPATRLEVMRRAASLLKESAEARSG